VGDLKDRVNGVVESGGASDKEAVVPPRDGGKVAKKKKQRARTSSSSVTRPTACCSLYQRAHSDGFNLVKTVSTPFYIVILFHPFSSFFILFHPASYGFIPPLKRKVFCVFIALAVPLRAPKHCRPYDKMATSSMHFNFYSLPPAAQEILWRITQTKEHVEFICEFLEECRCRDVVSIGSLSYGRSEMLASFAEFLSTKRLESSIGVRATPRFFKVASIYLNRFIDECHGGDPVNDASSPAAHTNPVKTSPTPELKRNSSNSSSSLSSSSPPSKKLKMLEPGKLLHLKVDHPLFWRYLIAFVSLLDRCMHQNWCAQVART